VLGTDDMRQRVYIDTNILGLVFDTTVAQDVAEAIGELCDFESLEFVTSRKTLQEILNHGALEKRCLLKLIYRFMSKLPETNLVGFVPALFGAVMFGEATFAGGAKRTDAIFSNLKQLFDSDDAEHIFQAVRGQCQFFLTLDSRTILERARRYQQQLTTICPDLRFVAPRELVSILRNENQTTVDSP